MAEALDCLNIGDRGPRIALLHGWGWDGRMLAPLARLLGTRCRVVQPDLPGYGRNLGRTCDGFDDCVDQLVAAVPDVDVLVGWSLGGLLAMSWAIRTPVRRLALISASPCFMQSPDWLHGMTSGRFDAFADAVNEQPERARTRFAALSAMGDVDARSVRAAMSTLVDMAPKPSAQALEQGLGWLRDHDVRAQVQALGCDVLCIHGEQDHVIDIEASKWLARATNGRCLPVPGAAHLPWLRGGMSELCDWVSEDG